MINLLKFNVEKNEFMSYNLKKEVFQEESHIFEKCAYPLSCKFDTFSSYHFFLQSYKSCIDLLLQLSARKWMRVFPNMSNKLYNII